MSNPELLTSAAAIPEIKTRYMRKQPGQIIWHPLHYMALEFLGAGSGGDIALCLLLPAIAISETLLPATSEHRLSPKTAMAHYQLWSIP